MSCLRAQSFILLGIFPLIKHCPCLIISVQCLFLKNDRHSLLSIIPNLLFLMPPFVLNFQDDILTVIRRVDENWAEGMLGDKIGIFPISYVEVRKHSTITQFQRYFLKQIPNTKIIKMPRSFEQNVYYSPLPFEKLTCFIEPLKMSFEDLDIHSLYRSPLKSFRYNPDRMK